MLQQRGWLKEEGEGSLPFFVEKVREAEPVEAVGLEENGGRDEKASRFDEKIEAGGRIAG